MVELEAMKMHEFGVIKKHFDRITHELIHTKKRIIGIEKTKEYRRGDIVK